MSDIGQGRTRREVVAGMAVGAAACIVSGAGPAKARPRLSRAQAERVGVDPAGVVAFIDAVERTVGGLHGMLLLRRGKVAAEAWWSPYEPRRPHMLFSLSKSFTSTAVGFAVAEGKLALDEEVAACFPESLPARASANLRAMRLRHLLTMTTGHDEDTTDGATRDPDGDWVRGFLALPVEHAPGSHWVYNTAATYMASAMVQKVTGSTVRDYLEPRLFRPLGIEGATWEACPRGISVGGSGLSVRTEDIARFGQMLLQRGQWRGRQIVPAAWVDEAASKQVSNGDDPASDWAQGYGYQFWRCRHGGYRGEGAFGQCCVVMPAQDAVLAITSGVSDTGAVLNAAWEHLLPAFGRPAPDGAADALKRRVAGLSVPVPAGAAISDTARAVSGRRIAFESNLDGIRSATLSWRDGRCRIAMEADAGPMRLDAPHERWARGTAALRSPRGTVVTVPVAARGAWTAADTFTVTLCFVESPFVQTDAWRFSGDDVTVARRTNVAFGPTDLPALSGRLSAA